MKIFLLILFFNLTDITNYASANDPYDNDLKGINLICYNESQSIDDWGIKFIENRNVILFTLEKFIYEIYMYKRSYRSDLRDITIFKDDVIDFKIKRKTLKFSNKTCSRTDSDPRILLEKRILDLKKEKTKANKI